MFEPFERDVERDVEASMSLFQRAHIGEVAAVEPRRPRHVLLVLDGSTQDATSVRFARHLHERLKTQCTVVDARPEVADNRLVEQSAKQLGANVVEKQTGESFDQVLAATKDRECDLIILPCPYGRDLESVGPDSVGTVIDVLLTRSPVPLLVVRQPVPEGDVLFDGLVMALIGENEAAHSAAEWAVGLREATGRLQLLLMLETEFYENVRDVLGAVAPDQQIDSESLGDALVKANVRLHRALQKAADAHGFDYALTLRRQGESSPDPLQPAGGRPLIVIPLERGDFASEGYVHDRIRRSHNALLIVPTPATA